MDKLRKSTRVAVGGICSALCLVIMLCSSIIPFATYLLPTIAGIILLPCAVELGIKTGFTAYAAVSILSILVVPDKEAAMMFIAFLGYYPMLKFKLDKIKHWVLRCGLKLVIFNVTIIAAYQVLIHLFGMYYLLEEFGAGWLLTATLALANFGFVVYDFALRNLLFVYMVKFRKQIFRL